MNTKRRPGWARGIRRPIFAQGDTVSVEELTAARLELGWQRQAERLATARGWWWFHDEDSRRNTPGMLDLVLIRERVVWIELKVGLAPLTEDQVKVIARLNKASAEVYVMRLPGDWEAIERVLA